MNRSIFTVVLLGAVCVLVKAQAHIAMKVIGCQTNDAAREDDVQLDGDEILYITNKTVVFTLPESVGKIKIPTVVSEILIIEAQQFHEICLHVLKNITKAENNPPEEIDRPQIMIYPLEEVELGKINSLICFVYDFYPPPVKVKWTKNNVEVKDGVNQTGYFPNPDVTFHMFSTLSITPEEGDVYSCSVDHKGLPEPLTKPWEPEANIESDMAATAFCGIGLTLGLLGVGVGTFFLIKGDNCN